MLTIMTMVKDMEAGKRDRMVGYYDKYYRWTRKDDGAAYDAGVREALKDPGCKEECHIIECVH